MFRNTVFIISCITAFGMLASAETSVAQDAASWTATSDAQSVTPGQTFNLKLKAAITKGWHIYSATPMDEGPVATTIEIPASAPLVKAGRIRQPKPIVKYDDAFGINTEYYEGSVTMTLPVKVKADAAPGKSTVKLAVNFMGCNDRMCLPPKTVDVPVTLTIGKGTADLGSTQGTAPAQVETAAPPQTAAAPKQQEVKQPPAEQQRSLGYGDERDVEQAKSKGLWAYIGLAMSVGALALLTPCVFPMIPITVSFFTKRESATRARSVRDAVIYSFGIIFTFTVLGIVLALTFGASGINQFAANPWINILIAVVFIAFALNLFGLFEIVVPSSVLTKLTVASGSGSGITSLLLMGLTFTLTSFTCTVPFVGTVMVAAASGEIWWSVVGMLAFSAVFAFPFFLLALFPSWLKSMPKSGGWLNSVKVVMGFLELAAAMKFISNVDLIWALGILSRDLFLSFWVGIGAIIVLYLLGIFQLPHDTKPERIGVFRMMFAVFFLGISIFLYTGLNGKPLGEIDAFMPPLDYQNTIQAASGGPITAAPAAGSTPVAKEAWLTDYSEALQAAKTASKPVFIDFTGFACTNCRWMEANVFSRPDVQGLLGKYVMVRLYTDGSGDQYLKNRRFQEQRFGTVALPLYVVMSPDDKIINTFPGLTRKPAEFVAFLEAGLQGRRTD